MHSPFKTHNGGESVNTALHRVSESAPVEPQGDPIAIARAVAAFVAAAGVCALAGLACVHWLIPIIERASR